MTGVQTCALPISPLSAACAAIGMKQPMTAVTVIIRTNAEIDMCPLPIVDSLLRTHALKNAIPPDAESKHWGSDQDSLTRGARGIRTSSRFGVVSRSADAADSKNQHCAQCRGNHTEREQGLVAESQDEGCCCGRFLTPM